MTKAVTTRSAASAIDHVSHLEHAGPSTHSIRSAPCWSRVWFTGTLYIVIRYIVNQ
jgi:hypothetical protein